jgi:hypothetical protein
LLAVVVAVEQARVLRQTKVVPTGAVAVVAVLDMTVDLVAAVGVRAVRDQVVPVEAAAELQRPVVPVVDAVQQVVAEALLAAQTHALAAPVAVLVSTLLAIRL